MPHRAGIAAGIAGAAAADPFPFFDIAPDGIGPAHLHRERDLQGDQHEDDRLECDADKEGAGKID